MAVGSLYRATFRWQFQNDEFTTTGYWEQTGGAGDDRAAEDLAKGLWERHYAGNQRFMAMLSDQALGRSIYCLNVPAQGAPQDEFPGFYSLAPVNGLRVGPANNPMDALKIQAVALLGAPPAQIRNTLSISGLSEDDITDGAFNAAYLGGPVLAFTNALAIDIVGPDFGGTFAFVVATKVREAGRAFDVPAQYRTSSRVGSQRRRQTEGIGFLT